MAEVSNPLRVGLAGLGNSGWFYHAQDSLTPSESCRLVAVCAHSAAHAARAAERFGVRSHAGWEELVDDPDVEVVVIALPHHLHRPVALTAAQAGKHVVVEKPMATTTADADAMIAAAERHGVTLTVFHQRRWEPDFAAIHRAVTDGRIGTLWGARETRSHQGHYRVAGDDRPHVGADVLRWPHEQATGGGVSYLIGPHLADHLLRLVPHPLRTVAGRVHRHPDEDVEHYIDLWLDFDDGTLGQLEVFRRAGTAPDRWAVYGTEGTITSRDGTAVEIRRFDDTVEVIDGLSPIRGCPEFYNNLYRAIRHGAPLAVTPEQGRDATRLLELGLASAARGGQQFAF